MGSKLELNNILQLTTEQGFPAELDLARHCRIPFTAADFEGQVLEFRDKPGERFYQSPPLACSLAHNIGGKWLFWGKVAVVEQTIHSSAQPSTSGRYRIVEIFPPGYQREYTRHEAPAGASYFDPEERDSTA